jgi:D-lactate dehydrogenase
MQAPAPIRQLPLLQHVKPDTAEAFMKSLTRVNLNTGDTLFKEGDPGDYLFVVESGALDATVETPDGQRCLVRQLGPGEVGGVTSICLNRPRSATLRASQLTTLFTLSRQHAERLIDERPDFSRSLLATLSAQQRSGMRALVSLKGPTDDSFRVAFFDTKPYDQASFESQQAPGIHFTWLSPRLDARTAELAVGHHAVCAFVNDDLSRPALERLAHHGIGLVALRCAGFNNVDLAAAKDLGITILRVPAYSPHAVAEHAIALLLTLNRHTHRAYNRVHEGNFTLNGLVGSDLFGRTAGVIGLGKIGRCCAVILRGFGMRVLGYDVAPDAAFAAEHGVECVDLETLVKQSDVISLHAPLVPATYHLINAERLALMKPGVMLLNTSRGALIDTKALLQALKAGQVGAAGLDVYEEESEYFFEDHSDAVISDDLLARLLTFNNVLVTSHQGFLTHQALANIAATTLENIRAFTSRVGAERLSNQVTQ